MLQILKIEWLKVKSYAAFWWIMGITLISYIGICYAASGFYKQFNNSLKYGEGTVERMIGNPFSTHEVWHTLAYLSSLVILIPSLIVIMLMTNEYTFKTQRQNVIDGWSRRQFLTGKLLDIVVISLGITLIYILLCCLIGVGDSSSNPIAQQSKLYFIWHFLLQTFSQLSIAFALGFFFRKSFMALGVFIFISAIIEPLLTWLLPSGKLNLAHFLPFEISDRLIPAPAFIGKVDPKAYQIAMDQAPDHIMYTLIFTFLLWLICYQFNNKRDL